MIFLLIVALFSFQIHVRRRKKSTINFSNEIGLDTVRQESKHVRNQMHLSFEARSSSRSKTCNHHTLDNTPFHVIFFLAAVTYHSSKRIGHGRQWICCNKLCRFTARCGVLMRRHNRLVTTQRFLCTSQRYE